MWKILILAKFKKDYIKILIFVEYEQNINYSKLDDRWYLAAYLRFHCKQKMKIWIESMAIF